MTKLTSVDKKLDLIVSMIGELDTKLDRTIDEVVDLKQDMVIVKDYLTTEVMIKADGQEIMSTLDTVVSNHKKFDHELTFRGHRITELTDVSDRHTQEIKKLQIAAA